MPDKGFNSIRGKTSS